MTTIRWCLGCLRRGEWVRGRCPACTTSPARRARKAGLYDRDYRWTRSQWRAIIEAGAHVYCPRCGKRVGLPFDLGHGPDGQLRPEHPTCNRSAGGRGAR